VGWGCNAFLIPRRCSLGVVPWVLGDVFVSPTSQGLLRWGDGGEPILCCVEKHLFEVDIIIWGRGGAIALSSAAVVLV
jgi:hypothetical protein